MRILVTIPHYYRATDSGFYGSLRPDRGPRIRALTACLVRLHQSFGPGQGLLYSPTNEARPTNGAEGNVLDIAVCTTKNDHVMDDIPSDLVRLHHSTQAPPPLLGFECHDILKKNIGRYDWYVFMEDDLIINDPFFFKKIKWFQGIARDDRCVLQPNRFELTNNPPLFRLYIDGRPRSDSLCVPEDNLGTPSRLSGQFLDQTVMFQKVGNPHSGCFFLNESQMRRWVEMPGFLDRATSYAGALESAATLGLIRYFSVYKPARENAGFLELEHGDCRYLERRVVFDQGGPYKYRVIPNKS
jgi:hypothetical protein